MKNISHNKMHKIIDSCATIAHTDFVEKYIQLYDKQAKYTYDNYTYLFHYSVDIIHMQFLISEKSYRIRTNSINKLKTIILKNQKKQKGYFND